MNKDFLWGAALSNVQAEGGYIPETIALGFSFLIASTAFA